ncbi:protein SERAC1 [Lutzomyia longipalpis]|uniref:protein SERAC1 n=1 Tax=Lutzomyia longipalpis TaxID=7200 RepID=UPI0024845909|nr:protein SERAC1 [Lutzomyia longipalpis]
MTQSTLQKKKLAIGGGILSAFGLIACEIFRIRKKLNALVDTSVMDYDQKRPDYIYVNYSIYRESIRLMQEEQGSKTFVNIISHPIEKWWKAMKHSVAWRLLNMAQTSDRHDRVKAVRQLVLVDHLKTWDYQHLAQICDARTAVSLARSNCDLRWFLPPRHMGIVRNPKLLLKDIHRLFENVQSNKCAATLLQKTFGKYEFQEVEPSQEVLHYVKGFPKMGTELELLKQCIDVLSHLSEYKDVAERIIAEGGLMHLMEIYKIFRDDFEMKLKICKVIANLSVCSQKFKDFFITGWITILAQWTRHEDMRICVTSAKTLRNLDTDDSTYCLYKSKIYPLYPLWRRKKRPEVDVVFVHGILGGVFVTWRQKEGTGSEGMRQGGVIKMTKAPNKSFKTELLESLEGIDRTHGELPEEWEVVYEDCPEEASPDAKGPFSISGDEWNAPDGKSYSNCWAMDWLQESFPDIRVIGLNYDSTLSEWYSKSHGCGCHITRGTVESRSREFLEQLVEAKVGQDGRPVVWVGHSMGGLIVKSIITQALSHQNEKIKDIGANTRGIMFLGTPHRGTPVAKLKQHTQMLLSPTLEVREMEENAKSLLALHSDFIDKVLKSNPNVEIVSIAEGLPTILTSFKLSYHVVTEESARIELGDFYRLNDDHLGICKPSSRHSFLYQRLLGVIQRIHEDLNATKKL